MKFELNLVQVQKTSQRFAFELWMLVLSHDLGSVQYTALDGFCKLPILNVSTHIQVPYWCKKWRFAQANVPWSEADVAEDQDAPEELKLLILLYY